MVRRSSLVGTWTVSAEDAAASAARCGEGAESAWQLLEQLVAVDSSPEHVEGLDQVVALVQPRWDRLGFETRVERTQGGLPVLVAERFVDSHAPHVLVLGHLDTVFPPGTTAARPFRIDGDRAFGPGVADMKGGVVCSLLAVESALTAGLGLKHVNLTVVNNTDEEAGSTQSRALIEALARDAALALVFEPGRPDGSVVTGRRGVRRYRIRVAGRAAHTGVEPWIGVNANVAMAHKVLALHALNDRERFLSVTCSLVQGGTRVNIVPDAAQVDVDVRIPDLQVAGEVHHAIQRIVERDDLEGATAGYEIFGDRPPMVAHDDIAAISAAFQEAAALQGLDLTTTTTGGGSDGCFTSALGVPTLDGLGPVGGGYHTADEFLWVRTLQERAAVTCAFLCWLDRGWRSAR